MKLRGISITQRFYHVWLDKFTKVCMINRIAAVAYNFQETCSNDIARDDAEVSQRVQADTVLLRSENYGTGQPETDNGDSPNPLTTRQTKTKKNAIHRSNCVALRCVVVPIKQS